MGKKKVALSALIFSAFSASCTQPIIPSRQPYRVMPISIDISHDSPDISLSMGTAPVESRYTPHQGDAVLLDGTPINIYDVNPRFSRDRDLEMSQVEITVADQLRRERVQSMFSEQEPFTLWQQLRLTVDGMTREQKFEYLRTGRGPPIIDGWVFGALPHQDYIDKCMGTYPDDHHGPPNQPPAATIVQARRESPRMPEPTTGGRSAAVTDEEERAMESAMVHLDLPRVVRVQPLRDANGHTDSRQTEPYPGYNREIARQERIRMMEGYDNFEQYARRARLIAQRNVEGRVYLQEQQRLIGPEDAVEKVNELYAAAQNDYEHFRSLLQIGDKNIPTRIVPHDEDLFKPISEKSARLLYQTLKEGTFKETGLSAQDTGLGAEITLTTCIGADEQTLIFAVKKEGISGLNIDDAFEDYGRWDFTCYTSLEDSARVLDSAYSVAYSRSYPAFSDLFRKGQVGLPSPPDEEGERFRPHPILEADIRELYSSLFDSVRRDAPRVWYSDNGNGIEVIFSLRGLTLQGTQYSREYVIAMRDGHIIGCKITDTDSNVARR